jgi:hypothetical protein
MSVAKPKAHIGHIGNGGIQGHSAGELFPYSVRGVGDTLQAFDGTTGRVGPRYPYDIADDESFREAHRNAEEDCRQWLQEDQQRAESRACWYGLAD